jgi:pimeloyl-ACP methyl ester carboxylesterase
MSKPQVDPPMAEELPIILMPGMNADERLFKRLRSTFPSLITPPWEEPLRNESLPSYARRLARRVDLGVPCLIGGVSFGGMVALEMSAHVQAKACVLISSVRSHRELPPIVRALRPLSRVGPQGIGALAGMFLRCGALSSSPAGARRLRHLSGPVPSFSQWASWAVLSWQPGVAEPRIPVFHIHGSADRTIPIRYVRPDCVVDGGGHVLTSRTRKPSAISFATSCKRVTKRWDFLDRLESLWATVCCKCVKFSPKHRQIPSSNSRLGGRLGVFDDPETAGQRFPCVPQVFVAKPSGRSPGRQRLRRGHPLPSSEPWKNDALV